MQKAEKVEKVVLKRSGKRPLEFHGELVASHSTSPNQSHPDWSGSPGCWSEARVYRTQAGRYVAWLAHYTQWEGGQDAYEAQVLDTLEELIEHLEQTSPKAAAALAEDLQVHETVA